MSAAGFAKSVCGEDLRSHSIKKLKFYRKFTSLVVNRRATIAVYISSWSR